MKAWVSIPVLLCVIALVPPLSADCESDYQDDLLDCDSKYGMFDGDKMINAGTCQIKCDDELERRNNIPNADPGALKKWYKGCLDSCKSKAKSCASKARRERDRCEERNRPNDDLAEEICEADGGTWDRETQCCM